MKKLGIIISVLSLFTSLSAQIYHETINFENNSSLLWLDPSQEDNIWEIGTPQKEYFNQAYSLPFAILTDSLSLYGENVFSSFVVSIKHPYWFMGSPAVLSFKHKFDTDTLTDGGYIDVSYDGGESWLRIIHDSTMYNCSWAYGFGYYADNFYEDNDTLYNGEPGFSGRSDDWETSSFEWWYCIGVKDEYPDSLMIRFNFISDEVASDKEGWMIDNIQLMAFECSAVNELENPVTASVSPNPVNERSILSIEGLEGRAYDIEIFDIQGRCIYTQQNLRSDLFFNDISLNPGLYFYQITVDHSVSFTGKLLK